MSYTRTSQQILHAIGTGRSTPAAIAEATGRSPAVVRHIATKLRRSGLADSPARGNYVLTDAGRDWLASGRSIERHGPTERHTRRARGLRVRAWWLMRQLGRWTLPELLTTLADGSQRTPRTNLLRYIHGLERGGIVRRAKRVVPGDRPGSKGHVLWILARDLGPQAPVLRDDRRELYDPNAGTTLPLEPQPIEPPPVAARQETHHD